LEELKRLGLPGPPGVPLAIAQAFEMEAALPRLLEHFAEKVGAERAPEVAPMKDPHNLSLWPRATNKAVPSRCGGAALRWWPYGWPA
jgi:hypothetical protein